MTGPVAVSTVVFDGHPFGRGLDMLAELGVARVEPAFIAGYLDFDESAFAPPATQSLAREIAARGLTTQALSAHMDLAQPDAEACLLRRIECAHGLGAAFLITNSGPRGGAASVLAALDRVAPRLEEAGVILALENPGHGTDDLMGTAEAAIALMRSLDIPSVRLNVDVGNFSTYGGGNSPGQAMRRCLPYAAHVHLKDYRAEGSDWVFTALGAGSLDYAALLGDLRDHPVGLELPLRLRRPGRGDPERGPVKSLDTIRASLVASLDLVRGV